MFKNFFRSKKNDEKDKELEEIVDIDENEEDKENAVELETQDKVESDILDDNIIQEIEETEKEEDKGGLFKGFLKGLTKTRENISKKIDNVLLGFTKIDDDLYEMLEDTLILSDIGGQTTMEIIDRLKDRIRENKIKDPQLLKSELNSLLKDIMKEDDLDNKMNIDKNPLIILVVGVNGVGKTTTIGKLANKYKSQNKKLLIAAADTFRAAAIDQLGEWANRVGVEMISHSEGADPAAVIFDSITAAKSRKSDIIICDTAGRLHNKKNLMNELNKIHRVIEREYPEAHSETLLVLDATTGQNAMSQAKEFKEVADISGVVLTKMDGTAKGGVVVRIQTEMHIPIKYIGLGEGIEDLKEFNIDDFVDSIIS
ncbi:MAG: signal recognition particle-docking protein FtsY [Tissierellia bacterium]|nr:signal recognition particle-docking protein FtsY [Tissierellia bacterium]